MQKRYPTLKARKKADDRFRLLSLGYDIYKARTKKKMTQRELAEKAGTKQSVIARIEAGKENMSISRLENLAEILGRKVEVIFT